MSFSYIIRAETEIIHKGGTLLLAGDTLIVLADDLVVTTVQDEMSMLALEKA